jgi:hypothetical protein
MAPNPLNNDYELATFFSDYCESVAKFWFSWDRSQSDSPQVRPAFVKITIRFKFGGEF